MTFDDDFDVFDMVETKATQPSAESSVVENGCTHQYTIVEQGVNVCGDCGVEVPYSSKKTSTNVVPENGGYDGNRCWAPKKRVKSIRDDLKGLGIPDSIINEADAIFKIVTKGQIFRVDKRRSIIVACLMEAYKIMGTPVTLEYILGMIPISNVTIGMRLVETRIKIYDTERKRKTYTSPADSIRDILSWWDNKDQIEKDIIAMYESIENKSMILNRSRAKSVAAAVVYYYALKNKKTNVVLDEFSDRIGLSGSTIMRNAREISAIFKTPKILAYTTNKTEGSGSDD